MSLTQRLRDHAIISTGILVAVDPCYTAVDKFLTHTTDQQSIDARLFGSALTYFAYLGAAYNKGRDAWLEKFSVRSKSAGMQKLHEGLYCSAFNFAFTPVLMGVPMVAKHLVSDAEMDIGAIAGGMFWNALLGFPIGKAIAVGIDTYKGLGKIGPESEHPAWTRDLNLTQRYAVASATVLGAVGLMDAMYRYL